MNDMKVSEQCANAASKGNQMIGLIRKNITYKEKRLIIPLYKANVMSRLEFRIYIRLNEYYSRTERP